MPKVIEHYVLERKIGQGQFGEVFKGIDRNTNVDIAVKVVQRKLLKGKFIELLENEIKVLRSCNNENIIKLYDLKKTSNNIYLILEYCNEGDLQQYKDKHKTLTEEEAVEFFIQILNGFKTLVQNNIMHRDFKLANILLHNGSVKIADFGFAKLLGDEGFTQTMLGSPLNMAPEVLGQKQYTNKADIWSIGVVFYELLFGKPPFTASNMLELLKTIQSKPVEFPKNINNISPIVEDVLRKMLVADYQKRIEWNELFVHEINVYLDRSLETELDKTLKSRDVPLSLSKFYIQNNKVITHPSEIQKKEELTNYMMDQMNISDQQKQQQIQQYKGPYVKRKTERSNVEESKNNQIQQQQGAQVSKVSTDVSDLSELSNQETVREKEIKINKFNANRLLHERNIYVFLASLAEDAMTFTFVKNTEIVGFLFVKKLLQMNQSLKQSLEQQINLFKLENWFNFVKTQDFIDILQYIQKEFNIFTVYYNQLLNKVQPTLKDLKLNPEILNAINQEITQNIDNSLHLMLIDYIRELIQTGINNQDQNKIDYKKLWVHIDRSLDCLNLDKVFSFEDQNKSQFNFKSYYIDTTNLTIEFLAQKALKKMQSMNISL